MSVVAFSSPRPKSLERQRIDALEAENDLLREEIEQLKNDLMGQDWMAPLCLGLTVSEERILAALMARNLCTKDHLHLASSQTGLSAETEPKIVDVYICKLRAKLKPFGIDIQTHWGRGYMLLPDMKAKVAALGDAS